MQRRGGCEIREKFLRKPKVGEGVILVIGALFRVERIVMGRNPGYRDSLALLQFMFFGPFYS